MPPLSLPAASASEAALADVRASEAGRLFCERAAAAGSAFVLTADNAADVAALCHRLDGLPLALELAAAQVKVFAIDELRARLENRLEELKGGARDLPTRQQTLRSTIEWSTALLTTEERRVFRRVSVFSPARLGDIDQTLRRVPSVADVDAVEALSSLVDKNLIHGAVAVAGGAPDAGLAEVERGFELYRGLSTPPVSGPRC